MKTNVILKSKDRELFGITIKQQTSNSHISISDLQNAYEKARWVHGWSDKRINDILSSTATKERIYYLLKERDLIKTEFPAFMEICDKEGIVKMLKGLGVWKTTGKGVNKSVYCDPYIWVLLAMELNPLLYAKVIFWITDSLIFERIEAGTEYKPMNAAIKGLILNPQYHVYAKAININVFGLHSPGMRNLASAKELNKISDIEKFITKSIEMGLIKKEEQVIKSIQTY